MSYFITYTKLVNNAAAAVMSVNTTLTYDQVITGFRNDLDTGNQTLAVNGLDYLSSLRVNPSWTVLSFMAAQNKTIAVANLQTPIMNFKKLLELKLTPNDALAWLQKLKPHSEEILSWVRIAIARIANMMEQHEDLAPAMDRIFDKDSDHYMGEGKEGLERSQLQELLSPAMIEELIIDAKISNLEHIFEETSFHVNKSALADIAKRQVKSGVYENKAYPELMRMMADAKAQTDGHFIASVPSSSTFNNYLQNNSSVLSAPSMVSPSTLLSGASAMMRAHPSETVVLAVFWMSVASVIGCYLTNRPSIFKYVSGKIMGCFSNKEAGQTYVPVSLVDEDEELNLDSDEESDEEENRSCFRRCFYSRSTQK